MVTTIKKRLKTLNKNECELCKIKKVRLQIHHKDKNPSNNDIFNLMNLCIKCHHKLHNNFKVIDTKRKCRLCEKNFIVKHSNQHFCNYSCRRRYSEIMENGTLKEFQTLMADNFKTKKFISPEKFEHPKPKPTKKMNKKFTADFGF